MGTILEYVHTIKCIPQLKDGFPDLGMGHFGVSTEMEIIVQTF